MAVMRLLDRPVAVTKAALVCAAGVGGLDYLTGVEIACTPLYLGPVCLATWYAGNRAGLITALFSVGCCITAVLLAPRHPPLTVVCWNSLCRPITFLVVAILLSRLKSSLQQIQSTAEQRSAALETERNSHQATLGTLRDTEIAYRKRLENEIIEAEERERRRIGRDLHDVLGQDLTGLAFLGKELEDDLAARDAPEQPRAARIVTLANQAVKRTRSLARGLCPIELSFGGLPAALQRLAEQFTTVFGVPCEVQVQDSALIGDDSTALHMYRIAQEATSNAIKHGHARHVCIRLRTQDGRNVLEVRDDGCGVVVPLTDNGGMGLAVMKYRASMMSGELVIQRHASQGTVITCSVPIDPADVQDAGNHDQAKPTEQEESRIHRG